MKSYRVHTIEEADFLSPKVWDDFVAGSRWGHILQSYRWGQFKGWFGWQALRLVLTEGEHIIGVVQLLLRRLPLGRTIAYIPRGPVVPPDNHEALRLLLTKAIEVARQSRAIFLKVEPGWSEEEDSPPLWNGLGMQPSATVQPRSTILLDLAGTEEEWLRRMKQKTRYNIRLSGRKGVQVQEGGFDDLPFFHRLMVITGQRDNFAVRDLSYYQKAWEMFASSGMATLLLASFEGEVLAAVMPFACGGTAWYMYGASSNRHRNRMPNYALQWAAMRWAKARGCDTYDLWGIPDEAGRAQNGNVDSSAVEKGSLWGVYRFKQGFGGYAFRTAGSYDAVLSPALYWAYQRVQSWRRG